jgi:hypothetical protein
MKITSQTIVGQNITILYESLDPQTIDTRGIKSLLKQAMVADIPGMTVVIDPTGPYIIQLGDRRIRVSIQRESQKLADLGEIAFQCHQLVNDPKLIAYGFNYDLHTTVENGDVIAKIKQMFAPCSDELTSKLGGNLLSVTPRLKFERDHILNDLILEPVDATHLSVHLNSHIQRANLSLSPEMLQDGLVSGYQFLITILPSILD